MKIRQVGAEVYANGRTDRQTDRRADGRGKADGRFSQFCERV